VGLRADAQPMELTQLSDNDLVAALHEVHGKLERNYKDRDGRLAAWAEEPAPSRA